MTEIHTCLKRKLSNVVGSIFFVKENTWNGTIGFHMQNKCKIAVDTNGAKLQKNSK